MLPYLTPDRYRSMGFGTEDIEDEQLRSIINRASLAVDRYCSVPMVPSRYSFRGGTVTDEEHQFFLGNGVNEPQQRVFWPRSKPIKAVSQLRVYVTNTQYVDFDVSELFVTKTSINVTSLTVTSIGLFGQFAVPVIGLATPIARITYTYGYDFDSVDEVLEPTDGKTFRAQNQFWNADTVTVSINGTPTASGWTADKTEGTIVFDSAQNAEAIITASYGYTMPNEVSQATGVTVADYIGQRDLVAKGMSGVQSLRVGEISIERPRPRAATSNVSLDIPNEAKQMLNGLEFISVAA